MCSRKYDDTHRGNISFSITGKDYGVRGGSAPNGLSYRKYSYYLAQKDGYSNLPQDFLALLAKKDYFKKLQKLVSAAHLSSGVRSKLSKECDSAWDQAFARVLSHRLGHSLNKFAGKGKRITGSSESIIAKRLNEEIYGVMWQDHPGWQRVQTAFTLVKNEYQGFLKELKNLSEETKTDWLNRIKTVELLPPWKAPFIKNSCAQTVSNAAYNSSQHTITVCAGYFTTRDSLEATLAHELSHSLGARKSKQLFIQRSQLGQRLSVLWKDVCSDGCPKEWREFKGGFDELLSEFDRLTEPNSLLKKCLQYHAETLRPLPSGGMPIGDARALASKEISDLAGSKKFFKWASETQQSSKPVGLCKRGEAPINPTDHPIPLAIPLFFQMEYRCRDDLKPASRLKASIEKAGELEAKLIAKLVVMGGRFSHHPWMIEHGYAENPEERFADVMGYRVFSRLVARWPTLQDRRQHFLLNEAHQCKKNDREKADEIQAEHAFTFEPHSYGQERRIEKLVPEIRSVLGCSKDFERKDCTD